MKIFIILVLTSLIIICEFTLGTLAANNINVQKTIIVAKDGSGDFKTIQGALNSISTDNSKPAVIFIKSGTYREKVFIDKNYIYLIGEGRSKTKIIYSEQKWIWQCEHKKRHPGPAVINIDADNILLMDLTAENNYGNLHADEQIPDINCDIPGVRKKLKPRGHQYVILSSSGSTKLMILNCNIIAAGADALCPWNPDSGMYYIKACYLEGYNDFVCPRGDCFITGSRFNCRGGSAGLWHDGRASREKKFVITNSSFDGVKGFRLGRYTHDAQFYLINCSFSSNMADKNIYQAKPDVKWGHRVYYYNCSMPGKKYKWLRNNLNKAKDLNNPQKISARRTFNGKWDPVSLIKNSKLIQSYLETNKNKVKKWH